MARNKYRYRDYYQTSFAPTLELSCLLLRKSDIVKIVIASDKDAQVFSSYNNAEFVIDMSLCLLEHSENLKQLDDSRPFHLRTSKGLQKHYEGFYNYLSVAMTMRLKSINFALESHKSTKEVKIVQDLCHLIKENDTIETVNLTLADHTNCISILDAWSFKPKIDTIWITCFDDLSVEVRKHIKMYKRVHIFKSVMIFISPHKVLPKQNRWVIF